MLAVDHHLHATSGFWHMRRSDIITNCAAEAQVKVSICICTNATHLFQLGCMPSGIAGVPLHARLLPSLPMGCRAFPHQTSCMACRAVARLTSAHPYGVRDIGGGAAAAAACRPDCSSSSLQLSVCHNAFMFSASVEKVFGVLKDTVMAPGGRFKMHYRSHRKTKQFLQLFCNSVTLSCILKHPPGAIVVSFSRTFLLSSCILSHAAVCFVSAVGRWCCTLCRHNGCQVIEV